MLHFKGKQKLDNSISIGATIPSIGKYLMWKGYWRLNKIYGYNTEVYSN